jgi:hypothetical protein
MHLTRVQRPYAVVRVDQQRPVVVDARRDS